MASLAFTAACASAADSPVEATGTGESAIINGTGVASATPWGMVLLNRGSGGCSAELLRNDLLITARHCVTTDGTITGTVDSNVADYTLSMDGQSVGHPSQIFAHPTLDIAVMYLSTFFKTGPSANLAQGWSRAIYPNSDASLVGTPLTCLGYGVNTLPTIFNISGTGFGTLRSAILTPSSSTTSTLVITQNASNQIQYEGDSGSSCFTSDGKLTGIVSRSGGGLTNVSLVGPEAFRDWVNLFLQISPTATTDTSNSSNTTGDGTVILGATNRSYPYLVTPNFNPSGPTGTYLNHNLGVWWNGQSWAVFNEDFNAMPVGVSFNVTTGLFNVVTATSSNISGDSLLLGSNFSSSSEMLIVTPNWNPSSSGGVYDNHAYGVWWTGSQWAIYHEDGSAMPAGPLFTVQYANGYDGAYIHHATSSNTQGDYTILDNPNLNGQPGAHVFVTQNWTASSVYNNHPVGVWYTGTNWAVFNEDLAAMPNTIAFNVMVVP